MESLVGSEGSEGRRGRTREREVKERNSCVGENDTGEGRMIEGERDLNLVS